MLDWVLIFPNHCIYIINTTKAILTSLSKILISNYLFRISDSIVFLSFFFFSMTKILSPHQTFSASVLILFLYSWPPFVFNCFPPNGSKSQSFLRLPYIQQSPTCGDGPPGTICPVSLLQCLIQNSQVMLKKTCTVLRYECLPEWFLKFYFSVICFPINTFHTPVLNLASPHPTK